LRGIVINSESEQQIRAAYKSRILVHADKCNMNEDEETHMDDIRINVKFNHHKSSIPIGIDDADHELLARMYGLSHEEYLDMVNEFEKSNEHYAKKLAEKIDLSPLHGKQIRIAFLGDSITSDRQSYMNIIRRALSDEKGIEIGDFAISGNISENLLGRFDPAVREYGADIAHIMIGTNDMIRINDDRLFFHVSPGEYEKNLDYVIGEFTKEGTKVIISTIPVFSLQKINDAYGEFKVLYRKEDREEFNDIIRKVASRYGATVNEMDPYYEGYDPYDLTEAEGIHLNALGHELMAEAVMKEIIESVNVTID